MLISKYCKLKGYTKEEYNNYKNNIQAIAAVIRSQLSYKNGVYYPVSDIIKDPYIYCEDWNIRKLHIIQELKNMDIEFINDNELYRVVQ